MTSEFIPIEPVEADVQPNMHFSDLRDVQPLIDRPAPRIWAAIFHNACNASPDIDWYGAAFAECGPSEVDRVKERLVDIAHSTNAAFATHLAEASPEELARLMDEGINFPSEGGPYWIKFP
jgi:hypothetical protein